MKPMKIYKNYIKYIKRMKDSFEFKWLTIDQMEIIEGYKKKSWEENQNIFLQSTKDNKGMLARNILENGMIFPFFSRYIDGKDWIILGTHRLESLRILEESIGNMKFLCIRLSDDFFIEGTFATTGEDIKILRTYPAMINEGAYEEIGDTFIPFEGFNDIEYFKRWLNVRQV